MTRRRPAALLLAAPLILFGCGRDDPAANNVTEAENRAVADLLDVPDNSAAAADDKARQKEKAASPGKPELPPAEPARSRDRQARRAGERG